MRRWPLGSGRGSPGGAEMTKTRRWMDPLAAEAAAGPTRLPWERGARRRGAPSLTARGRVVEPPTRAS